MSQIFDQLLSDSMRQRLTRLAADRSPEFAAADPYPHTVIDDFLPAELLEEAVAAFPDPAKLNWEVFKGRDEDKDAFWEVERLPAPIRDTLYFLNSPLVLQFLESLTGIKALIPDPYFYGGGLHNIKPGGFLKIHADFNKLHTLHIYRRLNLLLYLNKDWNEEYGGHLELWRRDMSECARRVLPVFNRCVIFRTDEDSFHGNPEPLTCPEGRSRRSIAVYYYTATLEGGARPEWHTTVFREKGDGQNSLGRETGKPAIQNSGTSFKRTIKRFVPPILLDAYRKLK